MMCCCGSEGGPSDPAVLDATALDSAALDPITLCGDEAWLVVLQTTSAATIVAARTNVMMELPIKAYDKSLNKWCTAGPFK